MEKIDLESTKSVPDISRFLDKKTFPEMELPKIFGREDSLVIFDIGACEGEDSIRYSRLFPNSRIFTFEPLPKNRQIIDYNFQKYGCENAKSYQLAFCNQSGSIDFHVSDGRPDNLWEGENWNYGNKSSSILAPSSDGPVYGWLEFKQKVVVPCNKLDTFCSEKNIERIDFIHMDVQGAELHVLKGAEKMIKKTASIWLEVSEVETYKTQCLRKDVESFMQEAGFLLAHFESRGEEGDQFYVNLRSFSTKKYVFNFRVQNVINVIKKIMKVFLMK